MSMVNIFLYINMQMVNTIFYINLSMVNTIFYMYITTRVLANEASLKLLPAGWNLMWMNTTSKLRKCFENVSDFLPLSSCRLTSSLSRQSKHILRDRHDEKGTGLIFNMLDPFANYRQPYSYQFSAYLSKYSHRKMNRCLQTFCHTSICRFISFQTENVT